MDTPIPTAALVIIYLSWVVVIGPLYMRDRKPFGLKNTLIYYNAFQVILSAYMFYEVRRSKHCLPMIIYIRLHILASDVRMVKRIQLYMRACRLLRRSVIAAGKCLKSFDKSC